MAYYKLHGKGLTSRLVLYFTLIVFVAPIVDARRIRGLNVFEDENEDIVIPGEKYNIIFADTMSELVAMSEDDVSSLAGELEEKYKIETKNLYSDALYGFTASNLTKEDLENLRKEETVLLVERDEVFSLDRRENRLMKAYKNLQNKTVDTDVNVTASQFYNSTKIDGQQGYGRRNRNKNKNKNKNNGNRNRNRNNNNNNNNIGDIIPQSVKRVGWKNVENNPNLRQGRIFIVDSGIDTSFRQEFNIDENLARNFVPYNGVKHYTDCNGHGTHVAGIIAARQNGWGIVGVAAGATIVPIRVLDCAGNADMSTLMAAVNYVSQVAYPGDVVNLSIGGASSNRALDIAVERAAQNTGAKFVVAAGNAGVDASGWTPARAQGSNIYTVCATGNSNKILASFSNFGKPPVDVCAPGSNILSLGRYGGTKKLSGTSMAAPHVSGALFLGGLKTNGFARSGKDYSLYPILA